MSCRKNIDIAIAEDLAAYQEKGPCLQKWIISLNTSASQSALPSRRTRNERTSLQEVLKPELIY